MKEEKVWGVRTFVPAAARAANMSNQVRVIVKATSRSAAARAMGISDRFLKDFGCVTGNETEIAIAKTTPMFFDEHGDREWHDMQLDPRRPIKK